MMKRIMRCLLFAVCCPMLHAQYDNGGVITTYVGDVDCYSGLLEVKNGGAADLLVMQNSSRLIVWSTSPLGYNPRGGIWDIVLGHNSHMDYYGGWTDELTIGHNATADLYGGRIDGISSYQKVDWWYGQPYNQHINIYARPGWYWKYENGVIRGITGLWRDSGTPFDIRFTLNGQSAGFDPVWININVIPEPATLALFVLGGLLLRRQK